MAEHIHHHHQQHRPHRLSLPSRATAPTTSRHYLPFTPTSTPSKHRLSSSSSHYSYRSPNKFSFSSLFLLLFSLRSLYSLLPFLRSSFSIFPFAFLVSLLSFILTLFFSLLKQNPPNRFFSSLYTITNIQHRILFAKSFLLAIVFLLRFQALRYCGTAAMILAETSGNVAARFVSGAHSFPHQDRIAFGRFRGFFALIFGLFLLSIGWDRIECFPLSFINLSKLGLFSFLAPVDDKCVRVFPMLLPFLSGFLGCYERVSSRTIRELGRKQVRLVSLFYTTILLFIPAVVSMLVFEAEGDSVSIASLGWPLANTVVFGVLLSENYTDDKLVGSEHFRKEFLVTFGCTLILELFYYPGLSLWGLLVCGVLLGIAVIELDTVYSQFQKLGLESSESLMTLILKPIRHILSERKSRKIALFLLINTGYMVVEFVVGFMSNSLGLISDACHMLFDCAALAIGLYASYIARLPANGDYNYGRGRFEVLSGYVNAVFLVLVGALIVLESLERILEPQEISTGSLLTVSFGGLAVNVVGLIFFHDEHHHAHGGSGSCSHSHSHSHSDHHSHDHEIHSNHKKDHEHHHDRDHCHSDTSVGNGHADSHCHDHDHHDHEHRHDPQHDDSGHSHEHDHHHHHHAATISVTGSREDKIKHHHHHIDHNMQGIFLHVLADTLGSVGVVISTLLIRYKGWLVADPACSMFISVLIVSSVIPLLRNSAELLLQRVPRAHEQELKEAVTDILKIKGVCGIQNLHVWSLTNTDVVGTLHLHVSKETDKVSTKEQISRILRDAGVKDLTLQLEDVHSS